MIEIRWHGRGGQGAFTAARLLGLSAALFGNKEALAFPSFGPERRGAPVLGFTRIDDKPIRDRSAITTCDVAVVLDETLLGPATWRGIKLDGLLIVNALHAEKVKASRVAHQVPDTVRVITLDAERIALETLGKAIVNTAMLGALAASSDFLTLEAAEAGIRQEMSASLAEKNIRALYRAAEEVRQ
jgi:pyruvate ferredoxin oxidoreductase gamma subunit